MTASKSVSFVFRLWLETSQEGERWRWHALHVQTGEEAYLSSVEDVLVFVARQSNHAAPTDTSRLQKPGEAP